MNLRTATNKVEESKFDMRFTSLKTRLHHKPRNLRCAQQRRDGAPLDRLVVELRPRNYMVLCSLKWYGLEYVGKISIGKGTIRSRQGKPAASVGISAYNTDSNAPRMPRSPAAPHARCPPSRLRTSASRRRLDVCAIKAGIDQQLAWSDRPIQSKPNQSFTTHRTCGSRGSAAAAAPPRSAQPSLPRPTPA